MKFIIFLVILFAIIGLLGSNRKNNQQQKSRLSTSKEIEEIMNISDPRVPEVVRAHGSRFRKPTHFVTDLGNGEYALSAEDGELLDLICLK